MQLFSSTNCTLAATAVVLSAGAAQGALVLDLIGLGAHDAFSGSPSTALVEITGITTNSASLGTNQLNDNDVAVNASGFGGSGTIGVTFTAGNAFNETDWTVTNDDNAILSSNGNNDGRTGLGVHDDGDGDIANRRRSLNGDEVLEITFDTSGLTTSDQLQFRIVYGNKGDNFSLYEQTGATAGSLLETVATPDPDDIGTSQWFDVDGLQTFAVQNGSSEGNLHKIEFQVVPEPGSLALLGIGGLLIARRRRD